MIQAILGSLCDFWLFLKLDTFTNPGRDYSLIFIIILFFIRAIDYFREIPDGLFFFDVVITTPVPGGIDDILQLMYKTSPLKR